MTRASHNRPLFSLDHWFKREGPQPYWLDPSRYVGIFPDEYPAPGVLHHVMIMVRTPDALREGLRLPWSDLPPDIRTRANDLVDLTMSRTRRLTGLHTAMVESNRNVIEPHRHIVAGDEPQSLWMPGRIGGDRYVLTQRQYDATSEALGVVGLGGAAQEIFAGTDWSVLGIP